MKQKKSKKFIILWIVVIAVCILIGIRWFIVYRALQIKKKGPENWYSVTRDIYIDSFAEGWSGDNSDISPGEEYTDKSKKFGYYLVDLNGDGSDEFLVGYDDGTNPTVFSDIYVWHPDFGPLRIMQGAADVHYYLCSDKCIKEDVEWGANSSTRYMKYNKDETSFTIVESGGMPIKVELTYFTSD